MMGNKGIHGLLLAMALSSPAVQAAKGVADPLDRPAVKSAVSNRSVMLAVSAAGQRLVALGERGVVLLSDDSGESWRQARSVPVAVTLTAASFIDDKRGWAVGHSGVVLGTSDGGETWQRLLDGKTAADLALQAAEAGARQLGENNPAAARLLKSARLLVADGADKPFLDVHFDRSGRGFVVGGYGVIFRTDDGGKTWRAWMEHTDNPNGLHLNAIAAFGDALYIAGERGLVLRSQDGGNSFSAVPLPYQGSFFAACALPDGGILVAGLRGNAFVSEDGRNWSKVELPQPITLIGASRLSGGRIALLNQAGTVFVGSDPRHLETLRLAPAAQLTAIADGGDGTLFGASVRGPVRLSAPIGRLRQPTMSTQEKAKP